MLKVIRIGNKMIGLEPNNIQSISLTNIENAIKLECTQSDLSALYGALMNSETSLISSEVENLSVIRIDAGDRILSTISYYDLVPLMVSINKLDSSLYKFVQVEDILDYIITFILSDKTSINLNSGEGVSDFYNWLLPKLKDRSVEVAKVLLCNRASAKGNLYLSYDNQGWYIIALLTYGKLNKSLF